MTNPLPSSRSAGSVPAKEATIYVPDAMHPLAEKYADEKFGRVVRPGDMSEEECLGVADAIGAWFPWNVLLEREREMEMLRVSKGAKGADSSATDCRGTRETA